MSKNQVLTRKDFSSDQAVRWCPGCGDYAILAQTQKVFPEITTKKEDVVFISGIGCSSRFPYYMDIQNYQFGLLQEMEMGFLLEEIILFI